MDWPGATPTGPVKPLLSTEPSAAVALAGGPKGKAKQDGDDESDWEYEYSTTETETYYLTVDLSHPDYVQKRRDWSSSTSRGGYRPWATAPSTNASLFEDDEDRAEDDGEAPEREEDNDEEGSNLPTEGGTRAGKGEQAPKDDEANKDEEIQILDLHSKRPLISYRGRVFTCNWASNIGTELIFAERDENNPLPALRHLPQDVDLLAASSARLMTTQAILRRKTAEEPGEKGKSTQQKNDRLKQLRKEHKVFIPIDHDKSGKRRPQARFLENLIAIKRQKGEKDNVTTRTKETRFDDVDDDPDEIAQRRKKVKVQEKGRARTETRRANRRAVKVTGGPRRGRRASSGARGSSELTSQGHAQNNNGETGQVLSTPTPSKWAELATSQLNENEGNDEPMPHGDDDDQGEEMHSNNDNTIG